MHVMRPHTPNLLDGNGMGLVPFPLFNKLVKELSGDLEG